MEALKVVMIRSRAWFRAHPDLAAGLVIALAFLARVKAASGTFLNPDEALHFSVANQLSLSDAYRASLTISHPPLLILVLYFWRNLGTSELVLRLPSVLLGTAFCWVFFRWLKDLFGRTVGWIGLIFAAFLPPMIALSAEIRQYALLLFCAACAAYFLERSLAKNSARAMLISVLFLNLALLTHYSALLFAATLGIYFLVRLATKQVPREVVGIWAAGQAVGIGLCVFLYLTSVKTLARFFGAQPLRAWMGESYLNNSYFDPARHHVLVFLVSRTGSVFQYLFGQSIVGDAAFLIFLGGIVLLLRNTRYAENLKVPPRVLASLLLVSFGLNFAVALAGVYPYGGTRHCVFLAPFAFAGVGFLLAKLTRWRLGIAVPLAIAVVAACHGFQSRRLPYMARSDQGTALMEQATTFVRQQVPPSDLVFVDNQTSILLGHYLCQQRPAPLQPSALTINTLDCGGHRILATNGETFVFTAKSFFPTWDEMRRTYHLQPGQHVWVLQEGWVWGDSLAQELKQKWPAFRGLQARTFGHNITVFELTVGTDDAPTVNGT